MLCYISLSKLMPIRAFDKLVSAKVGHPPKKQSKKTLLPLLFWFPLLSCVSVNFFGLVPVTTGKLFFGNGPNGKQFFLGNRKPKSFFLAWCLVYLLTLPYLVSSRVVWTCAVSRCLGLAWLLVVLSWFFVVVSYLILSCIVLWTYVILSHLVLSWLVVSLFWFVLFCVLLSCVVFSCVVLCCVVLCCLCLVMSWLGCYWLDLWSCLFLTCFVFYKFDASLRPLPPKISFSFRLSVPLLSLFSPLTPYI